MSKPHVRLMIDSGAYTAYRQNATIDVYRYGDFLSDNRDLISSSVNLDVIPGRPGRPPSSKDVEEAAEQGWRNLITLRRSFGLNPIAVYHMGEPRRWLEKMLDEGCDYIGLGGVANAGDKARRPWLDRTFSFLCGRRGYPQVKVHGFGITSVKMMLRYPWYSVDSVSWMKQGVIGSAYIPKKGDGHEYNYHIPPLALAFSKAGRNGPSLLSQMDHAHYDTIGRKTRSYIDLYLSAEGTSAKTMATDYKQRIRINSRFFKRFADAFAHQPYPTRSLGIFDPTGAAQDGSDVPPKNFRLVFSVGTYLEYANILRQEHIRDQLVSFHRIETGSPFDLKKYVTTGWFCRATRPNKVII